MRKENEHYMVMDGRAFLDPKDARIIDVYECGKEAAIKQFRREYRDIEFALVDTNDNVVFEASM